MFNYESPEEPPDFVFGADEKDFLPEIDNIKVSHVQVGVRIPDNHIRYIII